MNRREFLKSAFFTGIGVVLLKTGKAIAQEAKKIIAKVTTRKYQNINVSLLGFGCMRLPLKSGTNSIDEKEMQKMVDYAMEHGVNYYDTAWPYHGGKSEISTGNILKKYPRNSFYLADKLPMWDISSKEDVTNIFNEQLKKCQVDYFDFYLVHALDKGRFNTVQKYDIYNILNKEKQKGKIKYLGFSYHEESSFLETICKAYKWDFVQLQINPIDWNAIDAKFQYETAKKYNLPIVVMNPLKGGQLSTLNEKAINVLKQANPKITPSAWSIKYSASLPQVFTVLSGMTTFEHVVDNVNSLTNFKPLTQKEQNILYNAVAVYNSSGAISCTYCKYCIDCPIKIDIPKYFLMYNQYKTTGRKDRFLVAYNSVSQQQRADKCIDCGLCKIKCPQKLDIPALLKEVVKTAESFI